MKKAEADGTLKTKSLQSAGWNISGQVLLQLLNISGTLILARFLPPSDVGVLLMLSLVSGYAGIIMNRVLASAVTQDQQLGKEDYDSIFWLNMALAVIFYLMLWAAQDLIASFFRQPELLRYLPYFGIVFFFYAIGSVSYGLLAKRHQFNHIVIGSLAGTILSFTIAIIMVMYGFTVEALVIQLLTTVLISSIYFLIAEKWKPALLFKMSSIRKVSRFSSHLFIHSGIEYFIFNLDNFLVGRYFGKSNLGLYGRARQWVFLPVQNIAFSVSRGFFPSFAQIQGDKEAIKTLFLFSFRGTFFVTTCLITYMMVFAEPLVLLFMGNQWLGIVPLFLLFGITGITGTINGFNDSFITSQGKTGQLMRAGFWEKGFTIASIVLGIRFGFMGLIYGRVIASILAVIPKLNVLLKITGISLVLWLKEVYKTLLIHGLILALFTVAMSRITVTNQWAYLTVGSIIYFVLWWTLSVLMKEKGMEFIREIIKMLRRKR